MQALSEDMTDADFDEAFGSDEDVQPIALPMQMPMQAPPQMQVPPQMQRPMPRALPMPQQRPMPQPPHRPMMPPQMQQMQQMQQMSPYQASPFVLPLPPGMGTTPDEPFYQRKVGGLPVWMWGLIVAGGGTVAYFTMREKKDEKDSSAKASVKSGPKRLEANKSSESRSSDGWSPSRGRFVDTLNKKFSGKFEKVYVDADEAKASFKTVSPLINVKAKAGYQIDKAFESFCKADGLHPVMHDDNEIGLYPADGTARGREWEDYVNALRDDGQTV
jgi:hypothetical protein